MKKRHSILHTVFYAGLAITIQSCGSGLPVAETATALTSPTTSTTTTPTTPTTVFKKAYVTATVANADFKTNGAGATGIEGADNICMADASYPGTGTYKAFVVDGVDRIACTTANCGGGVGEHTDWVLAPNTEYRRIDGTTVIGTTNSSGIFTFPLDAGLTATGFTYIWTGFNTTNDWTSNATSCAQFATSAAGNTRTGRADLDSNNLLNVTFANCSYNSARLACIEQ